MFTAGIAGDCLQTYDLPVSERHEQESIRLSAKDRALTFKLTDQIPRRKRQGLGTGNEPTDLSESLEAFVDTLVGTMLELRQAAEHVARSSQANSGTRESWEPLATPEEFEQTGRLPLARLSWIDAARCLRTRGNEPRMDVIVRIAQDYEHELIELAESPRRVLRRERQLTPLGRVQQLDSACLTWFVRQPGRTAAEKAGSRQQIISVVRAEDYDTLENRVLKDFVNRCISAADLYIREHSGRYSQSTRFKRVGLLRERCRVLLRDTPLVNVRSLPSVPQPNYVLLHDPAYRKLWGWYLKLMRRQRQNDEAWRWQRRLWADTVRLLVASELLCFNEDGFRVVSPFNQHLWIREEQASGCWVSPVDWPGPVLVEAGLGYQALVQCVHPHALSGGEECGSLPIAQWLGITGADMAVVFSPLQPASADPAVCLFVWAIHSAAEDPSDEHVQTQQSRARKALELLVSAEHASRVLVKGIILRSNLRGAAQDLPSSGQDESVEVLGASVPADPADWRRQDGAFPLRYCLYECLARVVGEG